MVGVTSQLRDCARCCGSSVDLEQGQAGAPVVIDPGCIHRWRFVYTDLLPDRCDRCVYTCVMAGCLADQ